MSAASKHCHRFGYVAQVAAGPVTPQAIAAQRSDTGVTGVTGFSTRFTKRPCAHVGPRSCQGMSSSIQTTKEPVTPVTPVSCPGGYATYGVTGRDTGALGISGLCHPSRRLTQSVHKAGDKVAVNARPIEYQPALPRVDRSRVILVTSSPAGAGGGR